MQVALMWAYSSSCKGLRYKSLGLVESKYRLPSCGRTVHHVKGVFSSTCHAIMYSDKANEYLFKKFHFPFHQTANSISVKFVDAFARFYYVLHSKFTHPFIVLTLEHEVSMKSHVFS